MLPCSLYLLVRTVKNYSIQLKVDVGNWDEHSTLFIRTMLSTVVTVFSLMRSLSVLIFIIFPIQVYSTKSIVTWYPLLSN